MSNTIQPNDEGHTARIEVPGGSFIHRTIRDLAREPQPAGRPHEEARIVSHDELGSLEVAAADLPILRIAGHDAGLAMATTQCLAVSGGEPRPVVWQGRQIGWYHEDEEARYLFIADLLPADPDLSRSAQTRCVLDTLVAVLEANGMELGHLLRTWFYLDHILDWYGQFNEVRNHCFERLGIFDGLIPASTAIGAANAHRSALVAKALAISPKLGSRACAVTSPLQCPAPDYKSAFSRAVELDLPSHRLLHVSGTASIGSRGETLHIGDVVAQLDTTLEVVAALLASRGLDWHHTVRAIAYVRRLQDLATVRSLLENHPVGRTPLAIMQADICRDELLFELELEAADGGVLR